MSTSVIVLVAVVTALALAAAVGVLINRRWGVLREVPHVGRKHADMDTSDLGLSRTGPTIVHFSAVWCGPCASVRRVVNQVCADLPDVAHVEIDMDANPVAARRLSVLSLPTTFIFDAHGRQRYRTAGVPKAADLRSALHPLLA
jgi:thiol-disulfide isomerase/thioredoxin